MASGAYYSPSNFVNGSTHDVSSSPFIDSSGASTYTHLLLSTCPLISSNSANSISVPLSHSIPPPLPPPLLHQPTTTPTAQIPYYYFPSNNNSSCLHVMEDNKCNNNFCCHPHYQHNDNVNDYESLRHHQHQPHSHSHHHHQHNSLHVNNIVCRQPSSPSPNTNDYLITSTNNGIGGGGGGDGVGSGGGVSYKTEALCHPHPHQQQQHQQQQLSSSSSSSYYPTMTILTSTTNSPIPLGSVINSSINNGGCTQHHQHPPPPLPHHHHHHHHHHPHSHQTPPTPSLPTSPPMSTTSSTIVNATTTATSTIINNPFVCNNNMIIDDKLSSSPTTTIIKEENDSTTAPMLNLRPSSTSSLILPPSPTTPTPTNTNLDYNTPEGAFHRYQRKLDGILCQVCGDLAAGFHHGAYVCEACKKFFMRHSAAAVAANGGNLDGSSQKNVNFSNNNSTTTTTSPCAFGGQCIIRKTRRSKCPSCRYHKCLAIGMRIKDTYVGDDFDISKIPCRVCGNNSSGFHFGALTCEGCKGFFRRTDKPGVTLTCKMGNNCIIRCGDRNACKSCRYRKCREVGMSRQGSRIGRQPNAVKYHCAREIRNLENAQHRNAGGSGEGELSTTTTTMNSIGENHHGLQTNSLDPSSSSSSSIVIVGSSPMITAAAAASDSVGVGVGGAGSSSNCYRNKKSSYALRENLTISTSTNSTISLNEDFISLDPSYHRTCNNNNNKNNSTILSQTPPCNILLDLEKLRKGVEISAKFLDIPKERLKSEFAIEPIPFSQESIDVVWDHMMKHFTMHTNHIVIFAKSVAGFCLLDISVRRKLVRDSMYSLMMLELSRDYNLAADEYNYFDFSRHERNVILQNFPTFEGIVKHLRTSGRMLKPLELDNIELTLLCIIELFKNHNDVPDYNIAKQLYDSYQQILDDYLRKKCPEDRERRRGAFRRISDALDKMNAEHHDIISQLKLTRSHLKFPELYVDMFQLSPFDLPPPT